MHGWQIGMVAYYWLVMGFATWAVDENDPTWFHFCFDMAFGVVLIPAKAIGKLAR